MKYLIGKAPPSKYYADGTWADFLDWAYALPEYQLDVETDVSPWWCDKKLITIQLGWEGIEWCIQKSHLTQRQWFDLRILLEDSSKRKYIHNAQFEYIVLRFHGIVISNVWDTMVAEKIITGGVENANYSLADLTQKYLKYDLDKTEQKTFGDDILTENKVIYACADVIPLKKIHDKQRPIIDQYDLQAVEELEMKVVITLAEMTYHGMELDKERWLANEEWARPFVHNSLIELNEWIKKDEKLNKKAIELGYLSDKDRLVWNLNSPAQKLEILRILYPDLDGATKVTLKRYMREHSLELGPIGISLFLDLEENNYTSLQTMLLPTHRQVLIEKGYLLPADTVTLNWNSVDQALPLLKAVHPRLQNLNEQSIEGTTHPVFEQLVLYKDNLKLVSAYGAAFIEKNLEPDGKVRTSYNQIVSTGRLSSSKPNMQNIPVRGEIGTRYRNAFICPKDWSYVDSDYVSMELMIVAFISKDPVWMEAIERGYDLHSVSGELLFGKEWAKNAEKTCEYYYAHVDKAGKFWPAGSKQKCNCKKHKPMRDKTKTMGFGIIYSMGPHKLAGKLKITLQEAKDLIDAYFAAFPKIKTVLLYLQNFGIKNGYSITPKPFRRRRWYPFWEFNKGFISTHLSGQDYNSNLGEIGRQSGNHPIQGASADITKQALVYAHKWIKDNNLCDKIHLVAQVHDQVTTICTDDVRDMWKVQFDKLMCEAAKVVIPSGILRADTNITSCWSK